MGRPGKASIRRWHLSKDVKEEGSHGAFWWGKAVAKPGRLKQGLGCWRSREREREHGGDGTEQRESGAGSCGAWGPPPPVKPAAFTLSEAGALAESAQRRGGV